jgi:hypothetical protein
VEGENVGLNKRTVIMARSESSINNSVETLKVTKLPNERFIKTNIRKAVRGGQAVGHNFLLWLKGADGGKISLTVKGGSPHGEGRKAIEDAVRPHVMSGAVAI